MRGRVRRGCGPAQEKRAAEETARTQGRGNCRGGALRPAVEHGRAFRQDHFLESFCPGRDPQPCRRARHPDLHPPPALHLVVRPDRRRAVLRGVHDRLRLGKQAHHGGQRDPSAVHGAPLCRGIRMDIPEGKSVGPRLGDHRGGRRAAWPFSSWTSSLSAACRATSWQSRAACSLPVQSSRFGRRRTARPWSRSCSAMRVTFAVSIPFLWTGWPSLAGWGGLAFLGVFQIGISSILLSYGVKHVTALQSLLTAVLEPIFNPLWVFLVIGERPGPRALAGGAIILVAVTARSVLSLRSAARPAGCRLTISTPARMTTPPRIWLHPMASPRSATPPEHAHNGNEIDERTYRDRAQPRQRVDVEEVRRAPSRTRQDRRG